MTFQGWVCRSSGIAKVRGPNLKRPPWLSRSKIQCPCRLRSIPFNEMPADDLQRIVSPAGQEWFSMFGLRTNSEQTIEDMFKHFQTPPSSLDCWPIPISKPGRDPENAMYGANPMSDLPGLEWDSEKLKGLGTGGLVSLHQRVRVQSCGLRF